jgi:hypothetical protein
MTGCFYWLLILVAFIFMMATMIRWFEQTAEAVDNRWWNKLALLVLFPFGVWFFPSRVAAGRPVPVALHQPVMGMGAAPKERTDSPPPGTPAEFLGMPKIPAKKARSAPTVDAEKLAKLKEKMRQQGMLRDDDQGETPS